MSTIMRNCARNVLKAAHSSLCSASITSRASVAHARRSFFSFGNASHVDLLRRPAIFGQVFDRPSASVSPVLRYNGQKRSMFIQVQSTPNPSSLMFFPGKAVMEVGSSDFPSARVAMTSPLANALFSTDGVTRVFFGSNFVTVTKSDDISWDILKPDIFAAIMDFYASGKPLFKDAATSTDTAIQEDDDETVAMIKELLETRIRPAVQDDGGDIEYREYNADTGIVKLKMQGACSGCPSSAVTLKTGIENMLMHYIPEVKGVEEAHDSDIDEEEGVKTSEGSQ